MKRRYAINTNEYPQFWKELAKIPGMRCPTSKRNLRKTIRSHFFLDVHHKKYKGMKMIYLCEADVLAFKLRFS